MNIEEQKKIFSYLLRTMFLDHEFEKKINDPIDFYRFLLKKFQAESKKRLEKDDIQYIVTETVNNILNNFHRMDYVALFILIKHPDNFLTFVQQNSRMSRGDAQTFLMNVIAFYYAVRSEYISSISNRIEV